MSTVAPNFEAASASLTVNSTSWTTGRTISTTGLDLTGVSPIPVEVEITVSFVCPNSAPGSNPAVNVYVSESEDGTHYDDNDQYSGTNNSQTALRTPTNFKFLGAVAVNQNVTGYKTFRVYQNLLPMRKFGIILENQSGLTLTSPAVSWTPVNPTIT